MPLLLTSTCTVPYLEIGRCSQDLAFGGSQRFTYVSIRGLHLPSPSGHSLSPSLLYGPSCHFSFCLSHHVRLEGMYIHAGLALLCNCNVNAGGDGVDVSDVHRHGRETLAHGPLIFLQLLQHLLVLIKAHDIVALGGAKGSERVWSASDQDVMTNSVDKKRRQRHSELGVRVKSD